MAITFLEQTKKQRNLIIILGIMILIIAFVIWNGFFAKVETPQEQIIFEPVRKIEIDFNVFKNPLLGELEEFQSIEEISPIATSTAMGRENPFEPY